MTLLDYLPDDIREMLDYQMDRVPPRQVGQPIVGEVGELLKALHAVYMLRGDWEKYRLSILLGNIAAQAARIEKCNNMRYLHDWNDMAQDIILAHPEGPYYGKAWYIRSMWEALAYLQWRVISPLCLPEPEPASNNEDSQQLIREAWSNAQARIKERNRGLQLP